MEGANTRLLLHCLDAAKTGAKNVMIHSVDSAVVVLTVKTFEKINMEELWFPFGSGKLYSNSNCCIPIHDMFRALGKHTCKTLSTFHLTTRCIQTSAFIDREERTAFNV